MKNIGTLVVYVIMGLVLVALIALPQFAWNDRNGLVAINGDQSLHMLLWNGIILLCYLAVISWASLGKKEGAREWEYRRRVPLLLFGVVFSLVFWSYSWLSYISLQAETRVLVPGWGEYDLAGPMIFWCVVLLSAIALAAVTGSIFASITRGKSWSFQGLLLYKPD